MSEHPEGDEREAAPGRSTVVVVAGGEAMPESRSGDAGVAIPPGAFVIAADSGVDHALARGWTVDLAIGDFDSVSPAGLEAVSRAGARIERHPPAKDATDLELALDAAMARGAEEIVVVGGHGGRLDHLLAGLLLLTRDAYAAVTVRAVTGDAHVQVVRSTATLTGAVGDLVTLVAAGGPARGVTTEGLRYPLVGETLTPGSTRGVSNELVAAVASVSLTAGVLLAIQPTSGLNP